MQHHTYKCGLCRWNGYRLASTTHAWSATHALSTGAEPDSDSGLYRQRVFFPLLHDRDRLPTGLYQEASMGVPQVDRVDVPSRAPYPSARPPPRHT
ncbi:DUF6009 family protein [Streptomyces sp. Je 1-332]|uniref:DUF6009 family protein n=1 Tax=Streptomyces sp. Je 1-332 TaxID=3231270 RepID=UPI0034585360